MKDTQSYRVNTWQKWFTRFYRIYCRSQSSFSFCLLVSRDVNSLHRLNVLLWQTVRFTAIGCWTYCTSQNVQCLFNILSGNKNKFNLYGTRNKMTGFLSCILPLPEIRFFSQRSFKRLKLLKFSNARKVERLATSQIHYTKFKNIKISGVFYRT